MYREKIKNLEEMHRALNNQIDDIERNHPHVEVSKLAEMKKRKLAIKDEISRLNRLQWEHDRENLDWD
jgi:hypothetical protein